MFDLTSAGGNYRRKRETRKNGRKLGAALPNTANATALLDAWGRGDQSAFNQLLPLVHAELKGIARRYLGRERIGHTLQPTALVNEAYLRLIDINRIRWESRSHFLSMAARVMRRVLVDAARARRYQKRGGGALRVTLDDGMLVTGEEGQDLVALDAALDALAVIDPRKSRVVEMKFFGGLTVEEIAEILQVSGDTVRRDWRLAKLWLLRELRGSHDS
jgi:RNA polymerase sigma-70 factor (ECF subfamily)